MSIQMEQESTEYVYVGVSGTAPNSAEAAFLEAGIRPQESDWETATLVTSEASPLYDDAVASGVIGDYYVAILVGSYGGTGIELTIGDYQEWLRLTGDVERPVRIAPVTLEIV